MMYRFALTAALLGAAALPAQLSGVETFYTLTNDATDNAVQVGVRVFGRMLPVARYSTGGTGTAAGLGSQGALAATADWHHVLAVNPGSHDVTLFRTFGGLLLVRRDVASTGGTTPTSVDVRDRLVYVLNVDSDDITGFAIDGDRLRMIGRFPLSGSGVMGAQVGFDPTGRYLVATERATNRILVYPVLDDGRLGRPTVNASAAPTPFGFLFREDGVLVVSEAAGGEPGMSAVSTYQIGPNGGLRTITGAAATNQTAACWIAIPRGGEFAYTTNTGSASITGYRLGNGGALSVLSRNGITGSLQAGATPIDFDFDTSGRLLFVLDSTHDEIVAFRRDGQGELQALRGSLELPDGAAGLITR